MKILFCNNTLYELINFRGSVIDYFHKQGHEVVLVASSIEITATQTKVPPYARFISVNLKRTGRNPFADFYYLFQLFKIYKRERPDVIFHYTIKPNIYGTLAARYAHIPSFAMIAGLGYAFDNQGGFMKSMARTLYRHALRFSKRVFVLNEANRDSLLEQHMVKAEKILLLPGGEGFDTGLVKPSAPLTSDTPITYLMVGRVLKDKGYREFVEAARTLHASGSSSRFCLLGAIDESYPASVSRTRIEADVKAGHIQYLGFTNNPFEIMACPGTVVVLPSYHEGMNRSLMEACALGKPIITSDIPGCREMVREGLNGYLVPKKNAAALAVAIQKYEDLPLEAKNAMCVESRQLAEERFDIHHVFEAYEKVLREDL